MPLGTKFTSIVVIKITAISWPPPWTSHLFFTIAFLRAAHSQAVKNVYGPQKGYGEKRREIQGGGQEMAVMVG